MSIFLKQSTAATVVLGPFIDTSDGFTALTALTISQSDVRLSKNGAAFAQANEATSATHMENGYYSKPLNTTDTGTLGRLKVCVSESGALPVWNEYTVLPANVYDSFIAGTDTLDVNPTTVDAAVVNSIWAKAMSDLSTVPAATAPVLDAINLLFEVYRNKRTQTAATETLFRDDGSTPLGTKSKTDDGTTFTINEIS